MKCYGNVKGFVYRNQQPEVDPSKSVDRVICPSCRKVRRERDFWSGERRFVSCSTCRVRARDAKLNRKAMEDEG